MDVIHVDDGKYSKYEKMILERDRCRKEADLALFEYTRIFGDQITAVFEQKITCIELKKMLTYGMLYLNRGEEIDVMSILIQIKSEMTEYDEQLEKMIAENKNCKNTTTKQIPESDALKVKQIYRSIAKKLHPDLNPLTEQNEELKELWQRNVIAYKSNDLKEIEEVEVLVEKALSELGLGKTTITIPNIDEKIENIRKEIEEIKSTDPYLYKIIINDPVLIKEKLQELEDELNEYKKYAAQLRVEIEKFIK